MDFVPHGLLIISLVQQMSLFLVIAYLLSKTPLFIPIVQLSERLPHRICIYLLFSTFCILGTYFGKPVDGAIANTRAIGAVLGGLFGGPVVGFLVGLTGGLHRYQLGGFTDFACAISTCTEGLLAGCIHAIYRKKRPLNDRPYSPIFVFIITLIAEAVQMLLLLLLAKPYPQALALVKTIFLPMLIANPLGAALFMAMISDRKSIYDKFSSNYSQRALRLAQRIVGVLPDLNTTSARQMAEILRQETGVSAVAITDCHQVLAFTGMGNDHHLVSTPITSTLTYRAIANNQVIFADGQQIHYHCQCSTSCPLGSVLVIPLRCAGEVIGTVKLYESKRKMFLSINRTLGEGIAHIIEEQLVSSRVTQQQNLLTQAELKLVRAQIHPHFLFNALNTITAVIRKDPHQARQLIYDLALFLRTSLKHQPELTTLANELKLTRAYLHIEQLRYGDRLCINWDIPARFMASPLPSFTLQPLVENALKHGLSQKLKDAKLSIYIRQDEGQHSLVVEDNAGLFPEQPNRGVGLNIVMTRLQNFLGQHTHLDIDCSPGIYTRVGVPLSGENNAHRYIS